MGFFNGLMVFLVSGINIAAYYSIAYLCTADMNLQTLLDSYKHDPRLFQLADRLSFAQPQRLYCKGLRGSSPSFVISSLFQYPAASQLNHLIVCEDAEAAAYLHNSLENLTNALNIYFFPSSFKNRKNFRLLNPSHVMLRTEALTRFSTPHRWPCRRPGHLSRSLV